MICFKIINRNAKIMDTKQQTPINSKSKTVTYIGIWALVGILLGFVWGWYLVIYVFLSILFFAIVAAIKYIRKDGTPIERSKRFIWAGLFLIFISTIYYSFLTLPIRVFAIILVIVGITKYFVAKKEARQVNR